MLILTLKPVQLGTVQQASCVCSENYSTSKPLCIKGVRLTGGTLLLSFVRILDQQSK